MKRKNIKNRVAVGVNDSDAMDIHDFEALAGDSIEHLTVPGFFARFERRWHIDEMCRFGDKVGRAAEAMQLSYVTTIHPQLGMIRVFPLPLLQRVYEIMSCQNPGWPRVTEAQLLEDGRRAKVDQVRKLERADQSLVELSEGADDVEVLTSVQTVRGFIGKNIARIREQMQSPAPIAATAEAVTS